MRPAERVVITAAAPGVPGSAERVDALKAIAGSGCDVVYSGASAGEIRRLPPPSSYAAIVVDGANAGLDPAWLEELQRAVRGGTCVLIIGPQHEGILARALSPTSAAAGPTDQPSPAAAGVTPGGPLAEWFVKPAFGAGPLARRLPDEFPVLDRLIGLEAAGEAQTVLTVSSSFTERPVVDQRRLGSGSIVVSGIGNETAALRHPEIQRFFRRALTRPSLLDAGERLLGLGILGYGALGGMGFYHGLAARAIPGLELVAVCDGDAGRRKAAEEEFPGIRSYASPTDLEADDGLEIVVVATPPNSHFDLALSLLRAGKHVALEKPMCFTLKQADTLVEAARCSGRTLTVHQSRRWDPDFQTVLQYIERGEIGEVFNAETFVGGFEHPCRAWHSEVSVSGGAVYDWGSHHVDWILLMMGAFPVTLTATGHKRVWHDTTNLDQVRVRLGFEDGREAEFLQSDLAGFRRPKFHVQGTSGTIVGSYRPVVLERLEPGLGYISERAHHAEAPADLRLARYEPGYGLTETSLPTVQPERFGFHRNLADHLLLGEPLAVTPDAARRVVALLEAAQQSTDSGNVPISLPPL